MSRLIYVPQYPTPLRYQSWHLVTLSSYFKEHFADFSLLGEDYLKSHRFNLADIGSLFSPIKEAILLEGSQIDDYMNLRPKVDDILYCSDISFPGIFPSVLYHKKIKNAFAYVHGTSKNRYDYFSDLEDSKWFVETGYSKLFKKVFVGTRYHANKLKWKNAEVVGLPFPPMPIFKREKKYDIVSVARPCIQKITTSVEKQVEKEFGLIKRPTNINTWASYYSLLSESKILLITGKEDTFNYSIMEAIMSGCIPLAPNRCSYPELLPVEYIYRNTNELKEMIKYYLENYKEVPKLLNKELCENFYDNIMTLMSQ